MRSKDAGFLVYVSLGSSSALGKVSRTCWVGCLEQGRTFCRAWVFFDSRTTSLLLCGVGRGVDRNTVHAPSWLNLHLYAITDRRLPCPNTRIRGVYIAASCTASLAIAHTLSCNDNVSVCQSGWFLNRAFISRCNASFPDVPAAKLIETV